MGLRTVSSERSIIEATITRYSRIRIGTVNRSMSDRNVAWTHEVATQKSILSPTAR